MKRTTRTALSLLTSLTLHSIGFTTPSLAESVTVTRGPNFAAYPAQANASLLESQEQQASVPQVEIKGSQGVAPITQTEAVRETTAQSARHLNIITRGPNGAAHLLN